MSNHLKSNTDQMIVLDVRPESANWQYLSFRKVRIKGQQVLPPSDETYRTRSRTAGRHGYCPDERGRLSSQPRRRLPGEAFRALHPARAGISASSAKAASSLRLARRPAEGKYPLRLFRPAEIRSELRGGGAARRQVHHTLAHPLPAERLILYEVYVPGGAWSGYPPHCHDGYGGSAHLDETYYFRTDPANGLALHRNYRRDNDFEEIFAVRDRDLVLVTQGFHSTSAAPGSNLYFLNYLAGELIDDDRKTPPFDDPDYAWLKEDYTRNLMRLPLMD